ncbi:MAG: hypothetical protein ACR2J8_04925 [Thermomicrobiales bacterium]
MRGPIWGAWAPEQLLGVNDPYQINPLMPGERIIYCDNCHLGYHRDTVELLRSATGGACIGCQMTGRWQEFTLPGGETNAAVVIAPAVAPGTDEALVRLDKIWEHVGQVVTFECYVHRVYQSRGSATWFVLFEPKANPLDAFRLVIYNRYRRAWTDQGLDIPDYAGKTIRVRGIIRNDPQWGMQMLIDRPEVVSIVGDGKAEAPVVAPSGAAGAPASDPPTPVQRIIWKTE